MTQAKLIMPTAIPKIIAISPNVADYSVEPIPGIPGGVVGGVPGGQIGGVLGGVLGSTNIEALSPAPVVVPIAAVSNKPLHVGGDVKPPRLIHKSAPQYPALAIQARIQGDVEIDALIDPSGNVVEMHAMAGPALLISAALKAVSQWKYEPTYLNGQPYPIELIVHVTFQLS